MTEHSDLEARLRAADRPRPLPASLRERLEDELTGSRTAPLALEADTAGRLARRLTGAPPAPGTRQGRARTAYRVAGVAAALLLVGAVAAVAELGTGGHPSTSASRSRSAAPPTGSVGSIQPSPAAPAPAAAGAGAPLSRSFAPSGAAASAAPAVPGAPVIASLDPAKGPAAGGTWVTITGSHLSGVSAVRFGDSAATFRDVSDAEVLALSPPHPDGPVEVSVTTGAGASQNSPATTFTYTG